MAMKLLGANKFGSVQQPAFNCFHGNPRQDNYGNWYCAPQTTNTPIKIRNAGSPMSPLNWIKSNRFGVGSTVNTPSADTQQPTVIVDPPPTTMTTTGFDLQSFISDNKWLLAGGVAILAYFLFFSGGLGASDKTITSVTRYGRK